MKKIFGSLAVLAILLTAVACGGNGDSSTEVKVSAGVFSNDITLELGGELSSTGASTIKGKAISALNTYFTLTGGNGLVLTVDSSENVKEGATSVKLTASGNTTANITDGTEFTVKVLKDGSNSILKSALTEDKTNTFKFKGTATKVSSTLNPTTVAITKAASTADSATVTIKFTGAKLKSAITAGDTKSFTGTDTNITSISCAAASAGADSVTLTLTTTDSASAVTSGNLSVTIATDTLQLTDTGWDIPTTIAIPYTITVS